MTRRRRPSNPVARSCVPGARWESRANGCGGVTHALVAARRTRYGYRRVYAQIAVLVGPPARWCPRSVYLWLPLPLPDAGYRAIHLGPFTRSSAVAKTKRLLEQRVLRALRQHGVVAWDTCMRHRENPPTNEECDAYFEALRAGLPPPNAAVAAWFADKTACLW